MQPRVYFCTLGCAKNEVDTRDMAESLVKSGFEISQDAAQSDLIVINTCAFIQSATEESIDTILDIASIPEVTAKKIPIIVSGCMVSRYHDELADELPEAANFVSCEEESAILDHALTALGISKDMLSSNTVEAASLDDFEKTNEAEGHIAFSYAKISDGCDRFCSYCTIPFIRGRYHSFSYEDIEIEVRSSVEAGAKEIDLIAQDTGAWGMDFESPQSLACLVESLAEVFPETWFRVMYIQPDKVTEELLGVMSSHDNICNYLDIPFQHVDSSILHHMNRPYDSNYVKDLIKNIRMRIPDCAIRSTFIVGFPGETESQFEELLSFVGESELDYIGIFKYSMEDGTKAATFDCQIDEDEKNYRFDTLRDVADAVSQSRMSQRIGSTTKILVEGTQEDGQLYGRCQFQAPEVDGIAYIDKGTIGTVEDALIEDSLMYDIEASIIDN